MVQKAMAILVVGVIVAVAGNVFMMINMSANTTLWGSSPLNLYRNITPLIVFAGIVLVIIGGVLVYRAKD
jgi:hypothetical protein